MKADNLIVNTPDKEYEYGPELWTPTEAIEWAKREHPDWTSMVLVIVRAPNPKSREPYRTDKFWKD